MAEASPAPARACEPAEAADSADPRAALKAYLSEMANNQFLLQLHREFPKFKTMLKGWDGQQFIWQKRNKAVMADTDTHAHSRARTRSTHPHPSS